MKCKHCQRRLFRTEDPGEPTADVAAHLAGCSACRELQRRLVQLETHVPRLPVPASTRMSLLQARILSEPVPRPVPVARSRKRTWQWLAIGAAAAVILIACGVWVGDALWQALQGPGQVAEGPGKDDRQRDGDKGQKTAPDYKKPADNTLVGRVIACDLRLARAVTPRQRVEALADLADSLQGECRALAQADGTKELEKLARLYSKVVRDAVVPRSRTLPAGQRREVLAPIVIRLARARQDAERLAHQSPASARPLRALAATAREAELQLQGLLGKDA
jgi:hypothetical protein